MNWHDIPSLTALRAFEAAARHGSLSAAARDLNVTHAAIGQHLRRLEDHFGQSLMLRDGRGMATTAEGQRLAEALSEAFGIIGTVSDDLIRGTKTRPLRIATSPSFATHWLMPRIGGFWNKHPDIELEILPSQVLVDLRRDNIDVAVRYGRGNWPGVKDHHLMAAGHTVVAAPDYVAGRDVSCLANLHGLRWLMEGMRSDERFWLAENGIDLDQEQVTIFPTAHLVKEAVRSGHGITVLPAPIVAPEIASGALVELCAEIDSKIAYHLLTRPEVIAPSRDLFVKWMRVEARRDQGV